MVLRSLIDAPLRNVHVTLVNPGATHTYSGMVPGVIAGHYTVMDAQIDLTRLADRAKVDLILDQVVSFDSRQARLESGMPLEYDLLSLNPGSLPNYFNVPGAREHAVPAKPFELLLARWSELLYKASAAPRIAIAGAGAAGVELAMAMKFARGGEVVLYSDRNVFSPGVAGRILKSLERNRIQLRSECPVLAVEPGPIVVSPSGREQFDALFWTAGAAPLPWLRDSALLLDGAGYVLVDAALRSVSHPNVFAAGDTATLQGAALPRSGVFAVRQGEVLAENLKRAFQGESLRHYEPQARSLALISCGSKYAIASRGGWSAEGAWVWRWKDWIDRRWVAHLNCR